MFLGSEFEPPGTLGPDADWEGPACCCAGEGAFPDVEVDADVDPDTDPDTDA